MIVVNIKSLRSNFFLTVSNNLGKVIFLKSSGIANFKNIEKRTNDAFIALLDNIIQYLIHLKTKNFIFLKLEGLSKKNLKQIYDYFIKILNIQNIKFAGFKILNKVAHNGCRKKLG